MSARRTRPRRNPLVFDENEFLPGMANSTLRSMLRDVRCPQSFCRSVGLVGGKPRFRVDGWVQPHCDHCGEDVPLDAALRAFLEQAGFREYPSGVARVHNEDREVRVRAD